MSICLGCGLEQDSTTKKLQVKLCTGGGIKCATTAAPSPGGCTDGLYVDETLGCGLEKSGGTLEVHVQGQAFNTPVTLATAQSADCTVGFSPNCNGLVCTDQGLWAPPKVSAWNGKPEQSVGTVQCGIERSISHPTLEEYFSPLNNPADFEACYQTDQVLNAGTTSTDEALFFVMALNPCLEGVGTILTQLTVPSFVVRTDEIWRITLFDRLGLVANKTTTLAGNTWTVRDQFIIDGRGFTNPTFIKPTASHGAASVCVPKASVATPFVRGEIVVTINKVRGTSTGVHPASIVDFCLNSNAVITLRPLIIAPQCIPDGSHGTINM